jgi:histidinol-phosphatase (PHP family)
LPFGDKFLEPGELYREWPSEQVIREFLAEVCSLIRADTAATVLSHIDYAVRTWPAELAPFDVWRFEDEFRQTLRLLAETEMALEVNTVVPLAPEIVDWWREEGGRFIAFGSDAHAPTTLARGLAEAARMVRAHGFVPGATVDEFWVNAR